MAEYYYAKLDITNLTSSIFNNMTSVQKQEYMKNLIDACLNSFKDNSSFFLNLGIPQGSKIVSVFYEGSNNFSFVVSGGAKYSFMYLGSVASSSSFDSKRIWLKTLSGVYPQISFDIDDFTTPIASLVIPEPSFPITKYIDFMNKSSLYNSFISNVKTEMNKKYTVSVIKDFIYGILKNYTDGMVIFDYYQWQGNDDRENFEFRAYKNMYVRVFGIQNGQLVQKSFQIDHHLFSDIAGANLLDNGILINNDALTEKVGSALNSYQRKGYIIHANNCNLEAFIQKLQEEANYTLPTLTFPSYDELQEKIEDNKAFLTKGATEYYNERYAYAYAQYSKLKEVLGLTDAECVALAKEYAQKATEGYIQTLNGTIATEAQVADSQTNSASYQQEQANQAVQNAKDEAAASQAEDEAAKALEAAKVNDKAVKQKVIDYTDKLYKTVNNYRSTPKTKIELGLNFAVGDIESTGYRAFVVQIPVSEVKK